ncbi:MAG: class I SAM-dependent methyltransferase [Planctomycetota bacterium]
MPEEPTNTHFDARPEIYDAMVDWSRRLEREAPFYQRLFAEIGVSRVLDVACGTGHHAAMFNSWGLHVTGADVDPDMLAYCRQQWNGRSHLDWIKRSFEQPADPPASFDAAICVGNSLAIAADSETVEQVLSAMRTSIRAGGVIVVQVLNLWRLSEGPTTWQKCKRIRLGDDDRIVLKGIHRIGSRGFVDFVALDLKDDTVTSHFHTANIHGFEAQMLQSLAERAGLTEIQLFGSYDEQPYDREESQDIILVAHRRT